MQHATAHDAPKRVRVEWPPIVPAASISAYTFHAMALAEWLLVISDDLPQLHSWSILGTEYGPTVVGLLRSEYSVDARPAVAAWAEAIGGEVTEADMPHRDARRISTRADLGGTVIEVWATSYHHQRGEVTA